MLAHRQNAARCQKERGEMPEYTDAEIEAIKVEAGKVGNAEAAASRHTAKEANAKLTELQTIIDGNDAKVEASKKEAAEKNGEFKVLYEESGVKLGELTTANAGLTEQIQNYEARDKKELETLLETVPDNFKGLITDDLPLSKQLEMARTFSTSKVKVPDPRLAGKGEQPKNMKEEIEACTTREEFNAVKKKHGHY